MSGQWFVVRTRAEWADRIRGALEAMAAANGGTDPATIRDGYDADPEAFAVMVEGLVALGVRCDPEIIALAGLRDVGELL